MAALQELKRVKNAVLYQDPNSKVKCILLQNVRASYPFVGTPGKDEDDNGGTKEAWRMVALLPKDTHTEAKNMVKELIQELMKENDVKVPQEMWFLADGDAEKYEEEKHAANHKHWLVSCKDGQRRPTARNARAEVIDDVKKIDDMFYGGCWVNVMIRPWYFNGKTKNSTKTFPKRMLAGFQSIQFHHDDKPFGNGRIDDGDVYGSIEGAGDGMDESDDGGL